MKSKTILPEEEIELKEGSNQIMSNKINHQREDIRSIKDGITIRDSEIDSLKKELESRRLIIESLYYENQMLIEENAGLKAKNESLKESCSCSPYDQTGWITVKCYNHCGKSVEKFWKLS